MSAEGSVAVNHVWKRFRKDRGRRLLRDHLSRAVQVGRKKTKNPWRWVLRDIDFKVEPGESVAIVGVNGSGKSTLLKIVAGVMFPHTGRVDTEGRIGALIEVMSGIHQDLTGRENVLVYATLLGLSRKQVADRFDQIVEFAEVEDAIDRQVKFYSSGMKMRIGFSIAAFLEPSILIVDEVLAVGDASFQQKCLNRMAEVTKSGATLLLVSHDLAAAAATARRGIWLENSIMRADGPVDQVLGMYRTSIEEHAAMGAQTQGPVRVTDVRVAGEGSSLVSTNAPCTIELDVESQEMFPTNFYLGVSEGAPTPIFVVRREVVLQPGMTRLRLELPRLPLPSGKFYLWGGAYKTISRIELMPWHPITQLPVIGRHRLDPTPNAIVRLSPVFVESSWTVDRLETTGPSQG
ncbi:MAG TPA: ABC transporter ATP-binding protein [Acidimicrobiia bacterium]|jgi:ABC-2 type transport system ATP-binding protein